MDDLTVNDWMNRDVIGITKDESVADAAKLMTEKKIGVLVVFNRKEDSLFHKKKICGLITDSDIIRKVVAKKIDMHSPLERFMTSNLITATPDSTLQEIGNKMVVHNIKRIIITEGEHAVAIISITDFINWLASETGRAREVISEEVTDILRRKYGGVNPDVTDEYTGAKAWMTHDVKTVDAKTTVFQAADLMVQHYIGALPVKSKGEIIGMVTITDILRRLVAQNLDPDSSLVESIMSTPVISVSPTSTLVDVINFLSTHKIKHVPVIDGQKALVGMISHGDVIRVVLQTGMSHYLDKLSLER